MKREVRTKVELSAIDVDGQPEVRVRINGVLHGFFRDRDEAADYAYNPPVYRRRGNFTSRITP